MIRFPPKKILVAYDLSDVSRMAWRHARALAARCGAALEVVYVKPWQMGVDLMPPLDLTAGEVQAHLAKIHLEVGSGPAITVLSGDPAERILGFSRLHRTDMIVVGTHGRNGLRRALLGSTAEAVVRGSRVPVLIACGRVRPIRSILAPVNFTSYSEQGFTYAAAASAALAAGLKVLHVTDDPIWSGNLQNRLSTLIKRLPEGALLRCKPTVEAVVGDAVNGILRAKRGQDWIVLVAHRKSLIKDAFFGTTLEQVLRRSSIPVLSVPSSSRFHFALRVGSGRGSGVRERSFSLQ